MGGGQFGVSLVSGVHIRGRGGGGGGGRGGGGVGGGGVGGGGVGEFCCVTGEWRCRQVVAERMQDTIVIALTAHACMRNSHSATSCCAKIGWTECATIMASLTSSCAGEGLSLARQQHVPELILSQR